jgi:hypothetical protein
MQKPPAAHIRHTLDLAVRLSDAATGQTVSQIIEIKKNDKIILPRINNDGEILLVNSGRDDFELGISAKGYEPESVSVRYGELDGNMPHMEIFLIPSERYIQPFSCHTLEGELKGITEIDAVKISQYSCFIKELDGRKRLLTILNPYNQHFDRIYYAAVNADDEVYEPFTAVKQVSDTVIKIQKALEKPHEQIPVSYRVTGRAKNNRYLLRVRDDSEKACWIVRYVTAKGEFFQTVDFNKPETALLKEKSRKGGDSY